MRLGVQDFQFLVKFSQSFREVKRICFPLRDPNIPPWVEAPPLRLDFRNCSHLAETGHVNVLLHRGIAFCHHFRAIVLVFRRFVSIQPRNVGQELNLLWGELPMRSIYLLVNMTGINEQHLIRPFALPFGLVEEPEGAGECNGIEEIGGDTHHHIHRVGLDNLPADLQFRGAGIGGGVRHDKARPSGGIECAEEQLNPKIVGVVCAGHTERESWVILNAFSVHPIHIERRIRHHEVELVQASMRIFVVAVRLPDIAFQSMHGEVHLAEPNCLGDLFRSVNADLIVPILPVVMDKLSTLDKHTARTTRWVQNPPFKRLENLDNQFYERGGVKNSPPFAPSAIAKLPKKYS